MPQTDTAFRLFLEKRKLPTASAYVELLESLEGDAQAQASLAACARAECLRYYGNTVFPRALIEIGNVCQNDCLYCGLRRSNARLRRYLLTNEEILDCIRRGHALGFRSFVLQAGECRGPMQTRIEALLKAIRRDYPRIALTLSLGEQSTSCYRAWFEAGAERYLLRHEAINPELYQRWHPQEMSWHKRLACLQALRATGYQVGIGFMVGAPYQSLADLAQELYFVQGFAPHMLGLGPFIPQKDSPFAKAPAGPLQTCLNMLALIRCMHPKILLPATTALASLDPNGRFLAIEHGANVIMPNLSPLRHRQDYAIYDDKAVTGLESAEAVRELETDLRQLGYRLAFERGDSLMP